MNVENQCDTQESHATSQSVKIYRFLHVTLSVLVVVWVSCNVILSPYFLQHISEVGPSVSAFDGGLFRQKSEWSLCTMALN